MHGKKDKIVPFHMGKKVFEEANKPKYSYFPKEDDHMMEYNQKLLNHFKFFEIYIVKTIYLDISFLKLSCL